MALQRTRRHDRPRVRPVDRTPSNIYNRPENITRVDREAMRIPLRMVTRVTPKPAPVPNNVFAGKDGKVYQRDVMGNWKVNSGRTWTPTKVPSVPPTSKPPARGGTPGWGTHGGGSPVGTPGGTPGGSAPPPQRTWPQPAPAERPSGRQTQPPTNPAPPRPEPPKMSPTPGNLEGEFRARERAGQTPPVTMPPRPAPSGQPHLPKEKAPPGHKN
jgi:hypothetical protein